jgi:hypothetical protein
MRTTKHRLAQYRARAAASTYPDANWRHWRDKSLWDVPTVARGDEGQIFADGVDQYGPVVGECHDFSRRFAKGYYVDQFQDATIRGCVVLIRSPHGAIYCPVTYCDAWDGATYWLRDAVRVPRGSSEDDHSDAKRDAAGYADSIAQHESERAREYAAKDQAEQDIAGARERIHEINQACLELLRAIRQHGAFDGPVFSALRAQVRAMLVDRADQFRIIDARQDNYWSAVEY